MTPISVSIAPLTGIETTLYECPDNCIARVSVYGAERAGGTPTFTLSLVPNGETLGTQHQIAAGYELTANGTYEVREIFLKAGDELTVNPSDDNMSFTANGYTRPAS